MSLARRRRTMPGLTAAAALLALTGCTGSLFKSKEPLRSVYLLSIAPVPAAAAVDISGDITILAPHVRPGLDTPRIAALYSDRRLDHFDGARWSGPLAEVVQDLAVQAFRADARVHSVHGDISAFGSGYWLEIDVEDFQAEYAAAQSAAAPGPPTIHVRLVARLGTSSDRRLLGQFQADVREPAVDNRLGAIVDAYNRAAAAALGQIVADTGQALHAS